jgi:hypothetical protein
MFMASAVSLAVLFVGSSVAVIVTKRPGAKVHPGNNKISSDRSRNHNRSNDLPESNVFNAFRSNKEVSLPQPPPPPFIAAAHDDNMFLSPPLPARVENNNHLAPQPPQGPALVTPWHPTDDEELGRFPDEAKEPEASFDGFEEYGAAARIVQVSPGDADIYLAEDDKAQEFVDVDIDSPMRDSNEAQRNVSYSTHHEEEQVRDEGFSNYQFSPMSGSSQV